MSKLAVGPLGRDFGPISREIGGWIRQSGYPGAWLVILSDIDE
jgi:hypothetical protein